MSSTSPQEYEEFPDALQTRKARLEPFDWYHEMREKRPVRYDPKREVWDVFRYTDIKTLLTDDETFSIDPRNVADYDSDEDEGLETTTMIGTDPPRHDELRGIVSDAFQKRNLNGLKSGIKKATSNILEEILHDDSGVIDIANELAQPLVISTIAELLGVPADDRERFELWSRSLVTTEETNGGTGEVIRRKRRAQREIQKYLSTILDERQKNPQNDLLSRIATAEADDQVRFSHQEALGMCFLLFHASSNTTRNLLTNFVWCFATRGLWSELKHSDRLRQTAIEEALRYRSPVQATTRVATTEVTIQGETIGAGDRLMVWLGSANRDERQFDAPETFIPDRSPNHHMGFGHGSHYCLGGSLARLEADIVLSELLDTFETIELGDATLRPTQSLCSYGVESLPVHFEPITQCGPNQ
ncbi:cytochrome P450 [Halocatena pleomorpha]|uniref:Cytochrome P450 n=1 Tax=Halocatena pleomorpha TaxID=1785090 RepID=A0A3P3RKL4_9EURY|nr:cytochrome P450 [Halocatena pleomorpha]RRJ34086.1 cytochrome P450 [Halocatena pleomorpha]